MKFRVVYSERQPDVLTGWYDACPRVFLSERGRYKDETNVNQSNGWLVSTSNLRLNMLMEKLAKMRRDKKRVPQPTALTAVKQITLLIRNTATHQSNDPFNDPLNKMLRIVTIPFMLVVYVLATSTKGFQIVPEPRTIAVITVWKNEGTFTSPVSESSSKRTDLPPVIQQIADERAEFQINLGRAMDTLRRDMPEILSKTPGM
jgi:hypothetical protein